MVIMKEEINMKKVNLLLTASLLALLLAFAVQAETAGAGVSVILEENPTTGYTWNYIQSPEGILKEVSSEYVQDAGTQEVVGAGGKHTWTFEPASQGGTVLHYAYAKPFEEGVAPLRLVSFVYSVDGHMKATLWGSAEAAGKEVFISLAENPTTGYQWALEQSIEGVLDTHSDAYIPSGEPGGLLGAGGTHTWRFTAAAQGEVSLRFSHERSFEPGVVQELRFTFTVDEGLKASLKMIE